MLREKWEKEEYNKRKTLKSRIRLSAIFRTQKRAHTLVFLKRKFPWEYMKSVASELQQQTEQDFLSLTSLSFVPSRSASSVPSSSPHTSSFELDPPRSPPPNPLSPPDQQRGVWGASLYPQAGQPFGMPLVFLPQHARREEEEGKRRGWPQVTSAEASAGAR
ncbi:hypothetical protein C0Q70_17446 [Pomacea canaliculata]|uniref:Uncharacterized protein n=1 Tax=Pomacea canaliculata TaxID=400727 RepID=A0A2T7NKE7_POMCA|nr:hypothetical protein C0Q70_17446 [Pomacea canaliculata]